MRSRLGLVFLIVAGSCLAFTATAWACQNVTLVLPPSAGPGDTVPYSIAGIPHGTIYSFEIAGVQVSGANENPNLDVNGDNGTFTMPDLGGEQLTLTANGTCTCPEDAGPQPIFASMKYQPPPPAAPPSTDPSHGSDSTPAPAVPAQSSHQPKSPAKTHTPAASPRPAVAPAAQDSAGKTELGGEVAAPHSVSAPTVAAPQGKLKERSVDSSSSVPSRVLKTIGGTTSVGPAKIPTLGLVAIGLLIIAGLGLAGFVIYLFRNGPDPDAAIRDPAPPGPDPIEEELQQIIADEMARQLLSDLDLVETSTASR